MLLTSEQFRAVYERGQRFSTPFFTAFILKTGGHEQRLGVTVTRKLGGSVIRNRCKRRIRELFRRRHPPASNGVGYDLVINAKPGLTTADYQQLVEAFEQVLARFERSCAKQGG
jgi:ribonuclease P protein component